LPTCTRGFTLGFVGSSVVVKEHRPFEERLAREVSSDVSASEWFRVHKREAPGDVG